MSYLCIINFQLEHNIAKYVSVEICIWVNMQLVVIIYDIL